MNVAKQNETFPKLFPCQFCTRLSITMRICCSCLHEQLAPLSGPALEFVRALEKKDIDVALHLIETNREVLSVPDENGNCVLHWVILHEQYDLIAKLLEGETPWRKNKNQETPLKLAISRKVPLEHVEQLCAACNNFELIDITKFCLEKFFDITQDRSRAYEEYGVALIRVFQDLGVRINALNMKGLKKPIHLAAQANSLPLLTLLIAESNTCLTAPDGRRRTCLHYAAIGGARDVVQFLLDENQEQVHVHQRDAYNYSAMALALEHNHLEVCDLLMENGATLIELDTLILRRVILRLFKGTDNVDSLMYMIKAADKPANMIGLLLTEVIRLFYRGKSLESNAQLIEQLLQYQLMNVDVIVKAFDNAGFIFTKKRFDDERLQQMVSLVSAIDIDDAKKFIQRADRYRLFFPNYCDRQKIKEKKMEYVEKTEE